MPYPVANLPYGLYCRLADLTTPVEKYKLQIAVGDFNICPPTLQICKNWNCMLVIHNDKLMLQKYESYEPVNVAENDCILFDYKYLITDLINVKLNHLSSDVFNHFQICGYNLSLKHCDASKAFFEALSKRCFDKIKWIVLSNPEQDLCPEDVLTTFPHLEALHLIDVHLPDHWLNTFQYVSRMKLDNLRIISVHKTVGYFDADELFTFMQSQQGDFALSLKIKNLGEFDENIKKLKKGLEKHFVKDESKCVEAAKHFRIIGRDFNWDYYLPTRM